MVDAKTWAMIAPAAQLARTADGCVAVSGLNPMATPQPWPAVDTNSLSAEALRPWILPPVYARLRDGQASYLAEIRPSVALFLSFSGIDYDADSQANA
jgi:hypothetical protein